MAVSFKPTSMSAANFSDNMCRWDGRSAPHYEVWFLTLNHRASQRGFWFRYTTESPLASSHDLRAKAGLWAAAFSRAATEQTIGLKREYGVDQFAFDGREDFKLKLGEGFFSSSRAVGRVDSANHSIQWDLTYAPCDTTYHHVPRTLNRLAR